MTSKRITIVASELLGAGGVGGAGTADSMLAVALGRAGHDVDLLFARAEHVGELSPEWQGTYASSGVSVRQLVAGARVDPHYLTPTVDVFHMLRDDPPEIVIANDWRGLMLAPLRAREAGRAFGGTAFVILCHGPSTVLVEFSQKVPDTLERFAMDVAERTALGLADAVVSPSAWLLEWMRSRAWPVPDDAQVVQYISQATALGSAPVRVEADGQVRRLAFFGQMREGKGIRILVSALNALEPGLLAGRDLLFLGRETRRWTPDSVAAALAPEVRERLRSIRFETGLERSDALAELRVPGTLALMPSLLDNSPNTVSECIEQGIPFISTTTGGIPELVAEADRERVLVQPGAEHLLEALTRALSAPDGFAPARPGHEPQEALASWLELVESVRPRTAAGRATRRSVSLIATSEAAVAEADRLVRSTPDGEVHVLRAGSRAQGLAAAAGEWVLFLDESCRPDDELLAVLLEAQAASGADVVTCAVRVARHGRAVVRLALGDAGALGLVENHYGTVALIRRTALEGVELEDGKPDPDWPLLAGLILGGARVTTVPEPLGEWRAARGTVRDVPGYGLTVLNLFERARPPLPDLPLLAATLGNALEATSASATGNHSAPPPRAIRALAALRREGVAGVSRRLASQVERIRGRDS